MNRPVTYRYNIYGTFWNKICTTKPPVLIPISSNKNINIIIDDVIHSNDISTYDQSNGSNGELKKITMVITTYLQTEIVFLSEK